MLKVEVSILTAYTLIVFFELLEHLRIIPGVHKDSRTRMGLVIPIVTGWHPKRDMLPSPSNWRALVKTVVL